jgi:hypothetical protein
MGACPDLGSGLLRPVESPVPKGEGPVAPSSVIYKACRTGATRLLPAICDDGFLRFHFVTADEEV